MQQLGCESHSITCVSCYVHVYGNKVIIIIIIFNRHNTWTGIGERMRKAIHASLLLWIEIGSLKRPDIIML